MMKQRLYFSFFICFWFISCATSPTGRDQLKLVSSERMNEMGETSFEKMKKKMAQSRDFEVNRYVHCVARPITEVVSSPDKWEVVVFQDGSANAFALPSGKIGVHTGLLKVAENDDQLAAVIGHEVGHVLAEHSNERVSQSMATQGGLALLKAFTEEGTKQDILLGALGVGARFGILLPYSRAQEAEADQMGQNIMAKAGFRPKASVAFWKNMKKDSGGSPPEMLSTHPSHDSRIQELKNHLSISRNFYHKRKSEKRELPHCERPSF